MHRGAFFLLSVHVCALEPGCWCRCRVQLPDVGVFPWKRRRLFDQRELLVTVSMKEDYESCVELGLGV